MRLGWLAIAACAAVPACAPYAGTYAYGYEEAPAAGYAYAPDYVPAYGGGYGYVAPAVIPVPVPERRWGWEHEGRFREPERRWGGWERERAFRGPPRAPDAPRVWAGGGPARPPAEFHRPPGLPRAPDAPRVWP